MRLPKALFTLSISALALAACAPQRGHLASSKTLPAWAFEKSDVPLDPAWHFGVLPSGMRYAVRQNATPKGTALVRMQVDTGALDETEAERGYAHFIEHMAFNGSTHVPEGEMVKLLERDGLAFGADTNASTDYQRTTYRLDLPRNDTKLLDTALMLMRETASELTLSPEAVGRERGVVLAEMRDRSGYQLQNYQDTIEFIAPKSRLARRLPIGTRESLEQANAEGLKAFWRREYVPRHVTLFVVGDYDPAAVESAIRAHFGDWQAAPAAPQPRAGPFGAKDKGRSAVHIDAALSEHISAIRLGRYRIEPDSVAQRRENLLRQIGYGIINRRLLRRSRGINAPFANAGFSTSDLFKDTRATELWVDTVDGKWRRGLLAGAEEYRRALAYGFSSAEVAEQLAVIHNADLTLAQAETTRTNAALLGAALALVNDDLVPDTPAHSLQRLEAWLPTITAEQVLAALRREIVPLDQPLIRLQGRTPPLDGAAGLRAAWDEAMHAPVAPPEQKAAGTFAYTDFGPPGRVVSDSLDPLLNIREVRFANGVRLNLKHTALQREQVLVRVAIDGGNMIATAENPLATRMLGMFALGGLGKHSKDEIDSLLAGHTVSAGLGADEQAFVAGASTTPRDLELELQLLAAQITDPGYRREGEVRFYQEINNFFASLRATPGAVRRAELGGILSDNDPRFSLGKVEDYRKLTFAKLKADIADRLQHGAIEIAVVGDIDEAVAIALVARTFGALPPREAEFRPYAERRTRRFTAQRSRHVLHHGGARDQALLTYTWPTRDGEDPASDMQLALLQRVASIALTDTLREALGKAYSPIASSETSRTYRDYGTFTVGASVDVKELPGTRTAIAATMAGLRDAPISDDLLLRARAPMLEGLDNALKSNSGWMALADRAQTEPDRIERYVRAKERLEAITAGQLQALAQRYLTANGAVEIAVLPEGVDDPGAMKP